jgi:hypothetical protein
MAANLGSGEDSPSLFLSHENPPILNIAMAGIVSNSLFHEMDDEQSAVPALALAHKPQTNDPKPITITQTSQATHSSRVTRRAIPLKNASGLVETRDAGTDSVAQVC